MKKWIPNAITLLNLLCGCIAMMYAVNNELIEAAIFVGLGIFFDFFDGLAARLLNASGELGKQLDSLADLITSGLVPGIVMYQMLLQSTQLYAYNKDLMFPFDRETFLMYNIYFCIVGFAITGASALRLAKFNLDTRQTNSFIGLPTPANAILIISLGIISQHTSYQFVNDALFNPIVLLIIVIISCYLLNAELPLFSFKMKKLSWNDNKIRWVFLIASVALIILLTWHAAPLIIGLYILLSLVDNKLKTSS